MNDQDNEAFEKWCTEKFNIAPELVEEFKHTFIHKLRHTEEAWQAACEFKQKEYSNIMQAMTQTSQSNFKLQAENAKLRECVEFYADDNNWRQSSSDDFDRTKYNTHPFSEIIDDFNDCSLENINWFSCSAGRRARQALQSS